MAANKTRSKSSNRLETLRVLDVNLNRSSEGLRVLEDYCRFVLDDENLTAECKQIRHVLSGLVLKPTLQPCSVQRDVQHDVGTTISTRQEFERPSTFAVAMAAAKRVQQSLRSLEEFSKVIDPDVAAEFEQLRYSAYRLEHAVRATKFGHECLAEAQLYLLVDATIGLDVLEGVVKAGVDVVQLRDKSLSDADLVSHGRSIRKITRQHDCTFIANDRPDIARLVDADGIHVGQDDLPVFEVRRIVEPTMLVGVSTHSVEDAQQAVRDGANYIGVGPTFPSTTKQFENFTGLPLVRAICETTSLPAFAIGGIDVSNLDSVIKEGCSRVAVSGAIWQSESPAKTAREMKAKLTSIATSCDNISPTSGDPNCAST